jgi:predicted lipoprotein with Yx(FWY)xxD motif
MRVLACATALSMLAGTVAAASVPRHDAQGLLVDGAGHTLYRYDPDGASGHSRCSGSCAAVWPPYLADGGARAAGGFSVTARADGSRQWIYRGHPLYLFVGEDKPGDRDGDGVNGSWHVVR